MRRAPSNSDPGAAERPEEPVDLARRRLLSAGKYVAPAVIGVILLQSAGCQPVPSCVPRGGACVPDRGCTPDNQPPCVPDQVTPCNPDNPCKPDA